MAMDLRQHCELMHRYQGWALAQLYAGLAPLSDADYRRDAGLYFRSIHATLNHLAVADRIWLARVRDEAQPFARLDAEAVAERTALENYLEAGVAARRDHLEGLVDVELLAPLAYRNMAGEPQQRSRLEIVPHLVNHGTHHRGQISAALTAKGRPAPVLDYIYALPELP